MKCVYINLDTRPDRRARLEANWLRYRGDDWQLQRFPAVDTNYVEEHQIPGALRAAEKACFLSHCSVLAQNLAATTPLCIMEDDTILGPRSAATIDNFLRASVDQDWDIIFCEVGVTQPDTMIGLIKLRQELEGTNQVRLLDPAAFTFAGATAYIVNPRSLKKLGQLLGASDELNLPYDLLLRKFIYEKQLKSLVFFPYVSTLSADAGASQIREEGAADRIWTAFRQLAWQDRDLDGLRPVIEKIGAELCDDESRLLGLLLGGLVAKSFVSK